MTTTNSASCEIQSVIRFQNARGHNTAEIHTRLCETYRSCEQRSGRLSVRIDDLFGYPGLRLVSRYQKCLGRYGDYVEK